MPNYHDLDLGGWFTATEADVYRSLVQDIRCGTVVEVGVWKGRSRSAILDVCRANQNQLYAVDTWKPDLRDLGYQEAASCDVAALFRCNIACLGHSTTVQILQMNSRAAARCFSDGSIDSVFIRISQQALLLIWGKCWTCSKADGVRSSEVRQRLKKVGGVASMLHMDVLLGKRLDYSSMRR